MTIRIEHDASHHQFIAMIGDQTATLKYTVLPGEKVWDYHSTFVPPELRGRHIGQDLVEYALDYASSNGVSVIPSCPFVRSYIDRHPEYQTIIKK